MATNFAKSRQFLRVKKSNIPGILILDPRNFSENFTDTKSKVVGIFVILKKLSEKWFSHVLLLAFLMLYTCIGAWIFEAVEGGFEREQNLKIRELRAPINNLTDSLVSDLWIVRNNNFPMPDGNGYFLDVDTRWHTIASKKLWIFEKQVEATCRQGLKMGIKKDQEMNKWTFMGALFFSMTVFTTIGYGDNPPKTRAGQACTMVYAFIGIPLLLMVLADMGRIFTRGIKFVLKFIRRFYYMRSLRKVRRVGRTVGNMSRRATLKNNKYMMSAMNGLNRGIAFIPYLQKPNQTEDNQNANNNISVQRSPRFANRQPNPGSKTPFIIRTNPTPPQTSTQSSPPETPMPDDYLEIDDEFNIPITLAIIILIIYLLIGAVIFWSSERWALLHAFYFVFVSMSTIGFGDFIPSRAVLLAAFIYLLFGLALTSMSINVVQIKLSATFQRAKLLVGESIGLDVEQIMAAEIESENKDREKDKSRDPSADKSVSSKGSIEKSVKHKNVK